MSSSKIPAVALAALLACLFGSGLTGLGHGAPASIAVDAALAVEIPADTLAGGPVGSWLVGLEGDSVYERIAADPKGARLLAERRPADLAPLARRHELEVLAGQAGAVRAAEALGARVVSRYAASANGLLLHATAAQVGALAERPDVVLVEPAPIVRPQLAMSRPHIGATELAAETGYDGSGTYVAIIDTGVDYTHAHLGGPGDPDVWSAATAAGATEVITDTYGGEPIFPNAKVVAGWDFVGRHYNPPHICSDADMAAGSCTNVPEPDPDPLDGGNHGTHVAGIVAGQATDGLGDGIAPGAKIVGLKLYGRGGADEAADLLADAIDYGTRVNLGIEDRGVVPPRLDAINISLGETWAQGSRLYDEIVEAAVGTGIAIACSAGNSGDIPWVQNAPSASPRMMSVASSVPPSIDELLQVRFRWEDQEEVHEGIDSSLVGFAEVGAVEGELAWMGRACDDDALEQEVAEKVALVARGDCNFSEKLLNAQEAGAAAVVMFTDNRGKNAMGGSAAGLDIPSLMIDNAPGQALRDRLEAGTAISVAIDPEDKRIVPLPGDGISSFSSRGPSKNGALKPDITAPGSDIVSALAGSGRGGAAFSGTSMAGPMVAGAAAVIQQRNREEGLGLDGLGVSQLLMNYARPVVYSGQATNPVPVVRQGAGRVDLMGSGTATLRVAAGDIASINLGMVSLAEPWQTERSLRIHNHGAEDQQVRVGADFLFADDQDRGLTVALPEGPLTVPAGGSLDVSVGFAFEPSRLRAWDQWPSTTGSSAGQMNALELDGYVTITPVDAAGQPVAEAPVASLPFYALPRRASAIAAADLPAALDDPEASIQLRNRAAYTGTVELFALPINGAILRPGEEWSSDQESGHDPDEPEVLEELDIRAVGVRVEPPSEAVTQTLLSFAIARHARAAIPRVTRFEIYIDADEDGTVDHRVWEAVSQGRMVTRYAAWDPEAGAPVEDTESGDFARHATDLHSYVSILSVPLSALGERETSEIPFYVQSVGTNEDWLFMPGTRYEPVPNVDTAPDGARPDGGARYTFAPELMARLPERWSLELGGGAEASIGLGRGPGELDPKWLLVYPQNSHDGDDRQAQSLLPGRVSPPEPPEGIHLPWLGNGAAAGPLRESSTTAPDPSAARGSVSTSNQKAR